MTKAELVNEIAANANLTKKQAMSALEAFMGATVEAMKKDGKLSLIGFGTFSVVDKPARKGRNPRTGKAIDIPARKAVKFKVGERLKF